MNDKPLDITITVADRITSKSWQRKTLTLDEFATWLSKPKRSSETVAEFDALSPEEKRKLKAQAVAYIMGTLEGVERNAFSIRSRSALTLDYDKCDSQLTVTELWRNFPWRAIIHSTRQHRLNAPRARVIVPTTRDMTLDEFAFISRKVAEIVRTEGATLDETSHEPSRAMYAPTVSAYQPYVCKMNDNPLLDVDAFLTDHPGWRSTEWARQAIGSSKPRVDQSQFTRERYVDGVRTATFTSLTGTLLSHGIYPDAAWQLMDAFNQVYFDPPFDYDKFDHTFRSIWKREEAKRNGRTR